VGERRKRRRAAEGEAGRWDGAGEERGEERRRGGRTIFGNIVEVDEGDWSGVGGGGGR
jgi:hypothetical protein